MSNVGIMFFGFLLFLCFFVPFFLLLDFFRSLLHWLDPDPESSCDNCKNYAVCAGVAAVIQEYNMPEKCCAYWEKKKP